MCFLSANNLELPYHNTLLKAISCCTSGGTSWFKITGLFQSPSCDSCKKTAAGLQDDLLIS